MAAKTYRVNEVFYSLQGEGVRAGTPNVFVRFTGCNLECQMAPGPKSPGGFDCDTEFASGRTVTLVELASWIIQTVEISCPDKDWAKAPSRPTWLILTGGEPGLQVDAEFCDFFHKEGWKLAIETNGTVNLPKCMLPDVGGLTDSEDELIDWITLSPKVAEHAVKQLYAHELKYVRGYGQGIPKPAAKADYYLISPAFDGGQVHPKTLTWCNQLVLQNPQWRLSLQTHKFMGVR